VVANDAARKTLIAEGVPESRVRILGIPISVRFMTVCPRATAGAEFGLRVDLPSVLIMGGGWGLGPIEKIAGELDKLPSDFQMIVVCGKNKKLYSWFDKHKSKFTKPTICLGYTEAIARIMDCTDIVITKAGGITVSEALAKGLAIVTINPIPGQEEFNVRYLAAAGAVAHADDIGAVSRIVHELLGDRQKLSAFKLAARQVSFVDSSLRIADMVLGL
jgi:processive 1,2-diacylglycerol beta-glucosyltransferase